MHIPVLQKEVLKYLDPRPNENFIDATFGEGGHSRMILEKIKPKGKILAIEIDPELYKIDISKFQQQKRLILVNDSYVNLERIVRKYNFGPIDGILFDLGMCLWHLEESKRGFSLKREEYLDMRFSPKFTTLTAAQILNTWSKKDISKILKHYGQEKFASKIAQLIVEERKKRPLKTTFQLVEIVKKAIPKRYQFRKIHPATKVFQALRIAVNQELENLKKGLNQSLKVLAKNGRLVVISFHSLEDRIVKRFFKEKQEENILKILTKKPITPTQKEISDNPRSRSAKLRASIKLCKTF